MKLATTAVEVRTSVTMAVAAAKTNGEEKASSFYDDIEHQKKLCDFLRSKQGPPVREALLMEKRVHYMKGTLMGVMLRTVNARFSLILSTIVYVSHSMHNSTGEKLVNFLVEPKKGTKWPTNLPRFENRQDAILVCKELCKNQFLIRSEKRGKGELGVSNVFV